MKTVTIKARKRLTTRSAKANEFDKPDRLGLPQTEEEKGQIEMPSLETRMNLASKMTMLELVEQIMNYSKGCNLEDEFFTDKSDAYPFYTVFSERLGLTPFQALIVAYLVDKSFRDESYITDICGFFGCRYVMMLKRKEELEELKNKRLVFECENDGIPASYTLRKEALEAIVNNKTYTPRVLSGLSLEEMMEFASELILKAKYNACSPRQLLYELNYLLDKNRNLEFVKKFNTLPIKEDSEKMCVFFMCCHIVIYGVYRMDLDDFTIICKGPRDFSLLKSGLKRGNSELIKQNLVQIANIEGYFARPDYYELTDKAINMLLPEYKLISTEFDMRNNYSFTPDEIPEKELFYNDTEKKEIDTVTELFRHEKYKEICDRLEKKGLSRGFAILLSGPAGTGKTATVMEICRKTGHPIFQVDISQIRDKYVGESEKRVGEIFSSYAERVVKCGDKPVPVLFINEADAILGTRNTISGQNSSIQRMENTIQNIILQELEDLEGIVVFTTNLAQNFMNDEAMSRRILYKITLERPTAEVRAKIWKSMIPELSIEDAKALAEQYDLSGGQMANVVRKKSIDEVIYGDGSVTLDKLRGYCDSEQDDNSSSKSIRIGFV